MFCWLFARRNGGQFILRIDDTDQERNVDEALAPILHGLRWLGIDWDEGPEVGGPYAPYYQSKRADKYQAAVERLLAEGYAYRDYATPAEVQAERDAAQNEKRPFLYSRRFMADTPEKQAQFEAEGRQGVVRLKMPREGTLVLDDLVRGRVEFEWGREQDHVIQRADGTCLYHLANVVDDYEFKITHVIRAEEHLSNTPRQVFILQALGYPLPQYAHLPFVAEPGSRNKLSKRKLNQYLKNRDFAELVERGQAIANKINHSVDADSFNPVIVDFYETIGFLPDALINYLALLGWSMDDETEHFTAAELIESFSIDRVNKAPSSFDPKKLWAFEDRHFQLLSPEKKLELTLPFLKKAKYVDENPSTDVLAYVSTVIAAAGDRLKIAGDILSFEEFFTPENQFAYDEKALHKHLGQPAQQEILKKFREQLAGVAPFEVEPLEKLMKSFVEAEGIKIGQIIHAVRVGVTGKAVGLGMFDALAMFGKASCLNRIDRTLGKLAATPCPPPQTVKK